MARISPSTEDEAIKSLFTGKHLVERKSQAIKESLESWMTHRTERKRSSEMFDEYLVAMKRAHHDSDDASARLQSPRVRHRQRQSNYFINDLKSGHQKMKEVQQIATMASMVPDEIIFNPNDYNMRTYETALMFIDVSGFTAVCEAYTKSGHGGPSKLTQVLNSYIGAMVQEILTHMGDVLKFSGDAFLSMWRKTPWLSMQDVVHSAIDCGLTLQKNYGTHRCTDIGVTLKVKVAISAGISHFALIGGDAMSTYVIVGPPVWEVKIAENMSSPGEVVTSASVWRYVNEAEYCTQPCGDGQHTKVLGVGVAWKRVEKLDLYNIRSLTGIEAGKSVSGFRLNFPQGRKSVVDVSLEDDVPEIYREYSLRPTIINTFESSWWPALRRFMLTPVLLAVENEEPLEYLTEVRHVVIVFLNIITRSVTEDVLIAIVDRAYNQVCRVASETGGLVNKVSMFDKDMLFLIIFGMRGLKHEDEAQKALLCAFALKVSLTDPNITSVSIGVTSGRTYCGVVGHLLRREYTVIGSPVNKAARLMIAYPSKVSCDKETFVRSKLDLDYFRLLERKSLKGFRNPGPIYEFDNSGWPDRPYSVRHPILGRKEELRRYRQVLQNAVDRRAEPYTRYRDLRYGIILLGPRMIGKRRLLDEFLFITPDYLRSIRIDLLKSDELRAPFSFTRILMRRLFGGSTPLDRRGRPPPGLLEYGHKDTFDTKIRQSLSKISMTPLQLYAVNTIFGVSFPLPENFQYDGDLIDEQSVKELIRKIFTFSRFKQLRVVAVRNGKYIDDQSWRALLHILDTKCIFIIIALSDLEELSKTTRLCVANHMFVKMLLQGIDQWYHAALACQLLDVQAIPADLDKVLESASGGLPGWIQNFVISLIQRGDLTVETVPRIAATEAGAVMPCTTLLERSDNETDVQNIRGLRKDLDNEEIQMAVLAENYNFDNMKVDMTMDVIILKTYDALTPFEKMLLKCGSVLGDVFPRRMLLHLLQSDSPRQVAKAVKRLFEIRVLECEGGDFTRDTSIVLIHPAPAPVETVRPPYCSCLGTVTPSTCKDLPAYASCGYMKFRHALFRSTTYELLTENQKLEMHSKAMMYLERYTRRCRSCGSGCFARLFGLRSDDGLKYESKELKRVREQITALSAEARTTNEGRAASASTLENDFIDEHAGSFVEMKRVSVKQVPRAAAKRVRSFSSLQLEYCECLPILLAVYGHAIDHLSAMADCEKLFETYMEYVDLSLLNMNMPQAIRLLMEAEKHRPAGENRCVSDICKISWMMDYRKARILTMRGSCMLMSGEYGEAKNDLLRALKLFGCPFPKSKFKVKINNMRESVKQHMSMHVFRSRKFGKHTGWRARFFNNVSGAFNRLYVLFMELKEWDNAHLAAKKALYFVNKSKNNFRLMCASYGNMISVHRQNQQFSKGITLEKLAMQTCHRKRGQLDITEVYSVCTLYTSVFLLYVECGKKLESLKFGLSVIPMMSSLPDITVSHVLMLWMLKLLLSDLRIHEMVLIMREFFYMTDHYDLSSETWYYCYAILILLDTGYSVETYGMCEKFYIKKGDAILRCRTPESAWNFFTCMWLVTVRVGAWERSILWEEKIDDILKLKFQNTEFMITLQVRLVEGFLITYANELDNRNIKKIVALEKIVKTMFGYIRDACKETHMVRPRYLLLFAYFSYLKGHKKKAFNKLNAALGLAKKYGHLVYQIWIEHTKSYWKGTLDPALVDYWVEHVEIDNLLDYRDFDPEKSSIVPYTFPLPKDIYFSKNVMRTSAMPDI